MRPPCAEKLFTSAPSRKPPTSSVPVTVMPGMRMAMFWMLRAAGSSVMRPPFSTSCRTVLCTSTIGDVAGDRDGLLDAAHAHVDVHRRGERARTARCHRARTVAKPGSAKVTRVGARRQVDDAVLAAAVGHCRTRFLDERVAACFDGHAGEHRARAVPNRSRQRRLSKGAGRDEQHRQERQHTAQSHPHVVPPFRRAPPGHAARRV